MSPAESPAEHPADSPAEPPVAFLSGGIDSSIISSVAWRQYKSKGKQLHTFSLGFRDNEKYFKPGKFQPASDPHYIRAMNDYLEGSVHHDIILDTGELVEALYDAVDARCLPGMADVDSSLLLFCAHIKKYAGVALSGECADEIFGGYPWYRDPQTRPADTFPWAKSTGYRASFIRDEYTHDVNLGEYVRTKYREAIGRVSCLPGRPPVERRIKEMTALHIGWFMQSLLERNNRMSMYSALEVRVPYCDWRIAEYLYALPWEYKNRGNVEKSLLREAARGLLPEEVLWRKKSPFPKTHNPSFLVSVRRRLRDIINEPSSPILKLCKKEALITLLHADNPRPWYGQLMTTPQTIAFFIQMDYWMKKFNVIV